MSACVHKDTKIKKGAYPWQLAISSCDWVTHLTERMAAFLSKAMFHLHKMYLQFIHLTIQNEIIAIMLSLQVEEPALVEQRQKSIQVEWCKRLIYKTS